MCEISHNFGQNVKIDLRVNFLNRYGILTV